MKHESETGELLGERKHRGYMLSIFGILVGIFGGGIAVFYRLALGQAEEMLEGVLTYCAHDPLRILAWFLTLVLFSQVVYRITKLEPFCSGSGIPQIEGEMVGHLEQNWLRIIVAKITGGVLCVAGGLSLGREGPSIQLGAMAGKGLSRLLHRNKTEERFLLTCGASAGLSAAFNAPLAGILFSLEEIHKNFSVSVLLSVMTASVTADFISNSVFGLSPVFSFPVLEALPLQYYWILLLLGIALGVLGAFYNKATMKTLGTMDKVPARLRLAIPFLAAGCLGFCLPQVLGGGHKIIHLLGNPSLTLGLLLILLVGKFCFSILSFGSGAPGGIFFPLLVLGALLGAIFSSVAQTLGFDPVYLNNFIIFGMCGYFTAIVRAPITGIVLISEMTGSLSHLLSLTAVSLVAYITASLLNSEPIYESLLTRILQKNGINHVDETAGEKLLNEYVIHHGSALDGKLIREVALPAGCLIVSVKRGVQELIPQGATRLFVGDVLLILCPTAESIQVQEQLQDLTQAEHYA